MFNLSVVHISCGKYHTAILRENGKVQIFGLNSHGQCQVPVNPMRVTQVACGGLHTALL